MRERYMRKVERIVCVLFANSVSLRSIFKRRDRTNVKQAATSDAILINSNIANIVVKASWEKNNVHFFQKKQIGSVREILEADRRPDIIAICQWSVLNARHLLTYHENGLHVEIGRSTRI